MGKIETPEEFAWRFFEEVKPESDDYEEKLAAMLTARDAFLRTDERQKAAGWISVKEQPPEPGVELLLTGYLYNEPKKGRFTTVDIIENAEYSTHWMPKPPELMAEPEEAQG